MAPKVPNLKLIQWKYWAFLTGMPASQTKDSLSRMLLGRMKSNVVRKEGNRIVSVDMGIKNLAFCAIQTHEGRLRVESWRKMDLMGVMTKAKASGDSDVAAEEETKLGAEAFTPPNLSRTALQVTKELLSYKPDEILIERQRFRSGGAPAIQEWTARVNMLESMLWACLETLRHNDLTFPSTHAVSPQKVGSFWTFGPDIPLRAPPGLLMPGGMDDVPPFWSQRRSKDEKPVDIKKKKIEVLRSWVDGKSDVKLEFRETAAETAELFMGTGRKDRPKAAVKVTEKKLDDLADCLMQAIAWVRWEENFWEINRMWKEMIAESNEKE